MSQVPVWFERKFAFTFPVEQYPNLCVRLRGTPARLEEITHGISRDVLDRKNRRQVVRARSTLATSSTSSLYGWRASTISCPVETRSPSRI